MPRDSITHHRRSIRLNGYDYSQPGGYFVTICIHHHQCLLGNVMDGEIRLNEFGGAANTSWDWLSKQYSYVDLDEWIVMPNHLHGIIILGDTNDLITLRRGGSRTAPTCNCIRKPLGRLVGAFKTVSTKRINQIRGTPGARVWQRNFYDRIIRNQGELDQLRRYILDNPLKWELDEYYPDLT
jgi:putative transposase